MVEYRLDVRPFLDDVGGGTHVTDTLEIDDFKVGEECFVVNAPIAFDVTVSNAGEALVAVGTVKAAVTATCSRCLCDFPTEIVGDVEGYWPRPGHPVPEGEDVTGEVDSAGSLDLGPALMSALVVEAPFAPLHDEDCAGLCLKCGADLNEGACGCDADIDPAHPFAGLRSLVDTEDDS